MLRKHLSLITLAIFLGVLVTLWIYSQALAQIDSFTFFVPYPTDTLDDQFDVGHAALNMIDDTIETTISIAVHWDDTVIFYDHWEDGLEADLNAPTQLSTEWWGDNDPSNGMPPGFISDILSKGDIIVLQNRVSLPRDPVDFFYDGGDAFSSQGGAIAVTVAVWPIHTPAPPEVGILYAGAWELYPTKRWGLDYRIPVGVDLATTRPGFTVVGLNVQAVEDNTSVELDLDADGSFENTVILNHGEQFTQINGVTVGARVEASDPVQVHLFTANPAASYEARAYTMVPFDQWTSDVLGSRSSDGDFWLHNPNGSTMDVTVETFTTTSVITIPANSTVKYPPVGLSAATGVRFTSIDGRSFYGIAALDAGRDQDWGYALQPFDRLSTQTLVGWGPGNNNDPPGPDPPTSPRCPDPPPPALPTCGTGLESRVYVTAVSNTTVFVDYDNDGTPDDSFAVSPFEEVPITDLNDSDMTGAYLSTNDGTPFLAVWGQDESAPIADPSIDVGTAIVPLPSLEVKKSVPPIFIDLDCSGAISFGDTIRYQVDYFNNTIDPVANIVIDDILPAEVTYVPNSTTITTGPSLGPIPDGGTTPFPLDEGGFNVGDLPLLESGALVFDAVIVSPAEKITNTVEARSLDLPLASDSVIVTTPLLTSTESLYRISTTLVSPVSGPINAGDVLTFNITITNTGSLTFTKFPLHNTFDDNILTFLNATPPPDVTAAGEISWSDLITVFGDWPPGTVINLTVTFSVDQFPQNAPETTTVVFGQGAEHTNGVIRGICRDEAVVGFSPAPPALMLQKSAPVRRLTCDGTLDTMQFRVDYENNNNNPFTNVFIADNLPLAAGYVPNSTVLNGLPVPDGGGTTPFPLDEGGFNIGTIPPQQTGFLTFDVAINDISNVITNEVRAISADLPGTDPIGVASVTVFTPTTTVPHPLAEVDIRLVNPANGKVKPGARLEFEVTIANLDTVTITELRFEEIFEESHLTFQQATPPPEVISPGFLAWDDLTADFGDLAPGAVIKLTLIFKADSLPSKTTSNIVGTIKLATRSDGTLLQACQNSASAVIVPEKDDNGCKVNCNGTVTQTPPPTSTVFPVAFLPETGLPAKTTNVLWSLAVLAALGLSIYWVAHRQRRREN